MTIDELKAKLKADHKLDLDEIIGKASKFDEANAKAERADAVRTALKAGGIELSEDDDDAIVDAVQSLISDRTDLSGKVTSLSERIDEMDKAAKRDKAERLVRPYAAQGYVSEAERPKMVELAETNYDLAEGVLKGLSKGVLLSEDASEHSDDPPRSTSTSGDPTELSEDDASEVTRLAEQAKQLSGSAA